MSEVKFSKLDPSMHYKSAMGKQFIGFWDVMEDRVLTITKAELVDLPGIPNLGIKPGKASVLSFAGTDKKLIVNASIGSSISKMYKDPRPVSWVGKKITLFSSWDRGQGGKQVQCARVRETIPSGPDTGIPKLPVDEQGIERQAVALGHMHDPLVKRFEAIGVSIEMLHEYLGHTLSEMTDDEREKLKDIGAKIVASEITWEDIVNEDSKR
jgi:hypothetical protein